MFFCYLYIMEVSKIPHPRSRQVLIMGIFISLGLSIASVIVSYEINFWSTYFIKIVIAIVTYFALFILIAFPYFILIFSIELKYNIVIHLLLLSVFIEYFIYRITR